MSRPRSADPASMDTPHGRADRGFFSRFGNSRNDASVGTPHGRADREYFSRLGGNNNRAVPTGDRNPAGDELDRLPSKQAGRESVIPSYDLQHIKKAPGSKTR